MPRSRFFHPLALAFLLTACATNRSAPPSLHIAYLDGKTFARYHPTYPHASIRAGEEGVVEFALLCDINGNVSDARLVRTSGYEQLDNAVLDTARRGLWHCTPARDPSTNRPITSWTGTYRYTYRLK